MPIFKIHHTTKYTYNRQVSESINEIKIYPYQCASQEVLHHDLNITGHPHIQTFTDYWGNKTGTFNLLPPHQELVIESKLMVRTITPVQVAANASASFVELEGEVNDNLQLLETASADKIEMQEEIDSIAAEIKTTNKVAATVENCCHYIYENFKYIKGITNIETTVDEILVHKAGVCQDFAHLMLQILRTLHIPCRYISGYICPNKNGMRGEGATHAWVEAWIPNFGWAGIDPTNNIWVTDKHVKLAVGRNFNDCSPVKGSFKGPAKQNLSVHVSVSYEDGQIFEELNNVRTPISSNVQDIILQENMAAQQ